MCLVNGIRTLFSAIKLPYLENTRRHDRPQPTTAKEFCLHRCPCRTAVTLYPVTPQLPHFLPHCSQPTSCHTTATQLHATPQSRHFLPHCSHPTSCHTAATQLPATSRRTFLRSNSDTTLHGTCLVHSPAFCEHRLLLPVVMPADVYN